MKSSFQCYHPRIDGLRTKSYKSFCVLFSRKITVVQPKYAKISCILDWILELRLPHSKIPIKSFKSQANLQLLWSIEFTPQKTCFSSSPLCFSFGQLARTATAWFSTERNRAEAQVGAVAAMSLFGTSEVPTVLRAEPRRFWRFGASIAGVKKTRSAKQLRVEGSMHYTLDSLSHLFLATDEKFERSSTTWHERNEESGSRKKKKKTRSWSYTNMLSELLPSHAIHTFSMFL